jgi:hypothetical protein
MNTLESNTQKSGRGVPKSGFRMTTNRKLAIEHAKSHGIEINMEDFKAKPDFLQNLIAQKANIPVHIPVEESYDDIRIKVKERFCVMNEMVLSTSLGVNKSLILSGAPGVGKSTEVQNVIDSLGLTNYKIVKGKVTPTALFRLFFAYKNDDDLLVFDDSDSIFSNKDAIDILKSATDSGDKRIISWHSNRTMLDEDGDDIPTDFEYNGNVIFISNIDMYKEAESNNAQSEDFKALISRSFVLDLYMKNRDYYLARIQEVLFDKMDESKISIIDKHKIYNFMTENKTMLRELSLRMVNKLNVIIQTYGNDWDAKSKILLCK